jgi:hypothetical protein
MIRSLHTALLLAAGVAISLTVAPLRTPLGAQAVREGTIDPGMTRAQVEERLGPPKVVRESGGATYLFYANGCVRSCGMDDLVVLEQDAVTDAIFRSPAHRYTGQSSSPAALAPDAQRSARTRTPRGVTPIRSDSAMSATGRGGLVIGGAAPEADSVAPRPARSSRRPRPRRARPATAGAVSPNAAANAKASENGASGNASAGAAPYSPGTANSAGDAAGGVNAARTGRRSTTGPVDARAAVKNSGGRLYPAATDVRSSGGSDSSAARAPFQGSQLAPADSDLRALRRATPVPGQGTGPAARPDSTRP